MLRMAGFAAALVAAGVMLSGAGGPETPPAASVRAKKVEVTVETRNGPRVFHVEVARTSAQQERGLMFRTNIPADGGMLFAPYPGDGGPPRVASFWMKNTPSPLDILFIRPDRTIVTIAANVEPFTETPVKSAEPVSAVLELNAGKAAELGIAEGDKVRWAGK